MLLFEIFYFEMYDLETLSHPLPIPKDLIDMLLDLHILSGFYPYKTRLCRLQN